MATGKVWLGLRDLVERTDRCEQQQLWCEGAENYCIMCRNLVSSLRMFMEELMSPRIILLAAPASAGLGVMAPAMGGGITPATCSLGAPAACGGDLLGLAPVPPG